MDSGPKWDRPAETLLADFQPDSSGICRALCSPNHFFRDLAISLELSCQFVECLDGPISGLDEGRSGVEGRQRLPKPLDAPSAFTDSD